MNLVLFPSHYLDYNLTVQAVCGLSAPSVYFPFMFPDAAMPASAPASYYTSTGRL